LPVSLLTVVEREEAELELDLLIREARQRQRRRRLILTFATTFACGIAALAAVAATGGISTGTHVATANSYSASAAGGRCPATPARLVANSVFTATVIGDGPVRLGIGNEYEKTRRTVIVYQPRPRGWGGIEVLWIERPTARGPITVRGIALGKRGPVEVQPSENGLAPGAGSLTLPPRTALNPDLIDPGALWVRAAGCYAVEISGRGFSERIVFAVTTRRE
jgi:hypothetical protein